MSPRVDPIDQSAGISLRLWASLLLLLLAAPEASEASPPSWYAGRISLGTSVEFSRGTFENILATETWYVPVSAKYVFEEIGIGDLDEVEFEVSIPYLRVRESVDLLGRRKTTQQGFGDLTLRFGYYHVPRRRAVPIFGFIGRVKLPTAEQGTSLGNGLGTDELDYSLGLDVSKTFRPRLGSLTLGLFGSAEYRFVGDSPSRRRQDTLRASAGATAHMSRSFSLGLAYDWGQSSTPGSGDRHEVSPFASLRLSPSVRVGPYAVIGLSESSPDYAAGLSMRLSFDVR